MSRPVKAPEWASRLTADIPLPYLSSENAEQLRPFAGQCLHLVWSRLPLSVRSAIEKWWNE